MGRYGIIDRNRWVLDMVGEKIWDMTIKKVVIVVKEEKL